MNKVYRGKRVLISLESEVMTKVTLDSTELRSQLKPYEDFHDFSTID